MEFRDNRIYSRRTHPNHGINQARWEPVGEFDRPEDAEETNRFAASASDYGSDYDLEAGAGQYDEKSRRASVEQEFHNSGEKMIEAVKNFFGVGPENYVRSDTRILEDVNEAFLHDACLDATHIELSVEKGILHLEGSVPDRSSKWRAEDLTDGIAGLIEVCNYLRVGQESQEEMEFPPSKDGPFGNPGLPGTTTTGGFNNSIPSPKR